MRLKFADLSIIGWAQTWPTPIATRADVAEIGQSILLRLLPVDRGVRLFGLTLSGLAGPNLRSAPSSDLTLFSLEAHDTARAD